METLTQKAYAKINISLDILGKQEDGYHQMKMIMNEVSLYDDIRIRLNTGKPDTVKTNLNYIPSDSNNIAMRCAKSFFETIGETVNGIEINIIKRIPVSAGLGGGSSDGAAVLRALNEYYDHPVGTEQMIGLSEKVGADIPYCYLGGTKLAEGKGEILTELPQMPQCWCVLCKPVFSLSTKAMFNLIDTRRIREHPDTDGIIRYLKEGNIDEISRRMFNVFEGFLGSHEKDIKYIKNVMLNAGAVGAVMSGSGPTVFGFFKEKNLAANAEKVLKQSYNDVFLTETR